MFHNLVRFAMSDSALRIASTAYHLLTADDSDTGSEITAVETALKAVTACKVIGRSIDDFIVDLASPEATDTGLSIKDRLRMEFLAGGGSKLRIEIPQPKLNLFVKNEDLDETQATYTTLRALVTGGIIRTSEGGTPASLISGKRSRRRRKV